MKGSNVKNLASIIERFPHGTKYEYSLFDMETREDWDGSITFKFRLPRKGVSPQHMSDLVALLSDNSV